MGCSASSEISAGPHDQSVAPIITDAREIAAAAMAAAEARSQISATSVNTAGVLSGGSVRIPKAKGAAPAPAMPCVDVRSLYEFGGVLGSGAFGTVYRVLPIGAPPGTAHLACKSIPKRKLLSETDIEDVRREVQIMSHLAHHPHVVNLVGSYEDDRDIHLVMQLCKGGELFDRIEDAGFFSESDAARVMRTLVDVVQHCHEMGVVHRDIKPENFLLESDEPDAVMRATDFGLSRFFQEGEVFHDVVGSPYYVAPEVLRQSYGKEADVWSCGVVLYILLSGLPPYGGDGNAEIFEEVLCGALDLTSHPWPKISSHAKDLVKKMLVRDPTQRLTAHQVLVHPWMKVQGVAPTTPLEPEVLQRLRHFSKMNRLKKEALKIVATNLPEHELAGLHELFRSMDQDGNGTITVDEMHQALKSKGSLVGNEEARKVFDGIAEGVNGGAKINYEEFLAATLQLSKVNREDLLMQAFQHFDKDNSGHITQDELKAALRENLNPEHMEDILREVDANSDGSIDYKEFCIMMRGHTRQEMTSSPTSPAPQESTGGFLRVGPGLKHDAEAVVARVGARHAPDE